MKKIILVALISFFVSNLFADVSVKITDESGNFNYVTIPGELVEGENRFYLDVEDTNSGMFGHNFCIIYPEYPINCQDNDNDGYDDCDGSIGDGLPVDCDDNTGLVNPGIGENCNDGIDNDCNNLIDEYDAACQQSGSIPTDYIVYYDMNYDSNGYIDDMSSNNLDMNIYGTPFIDTGINDSSFNLSESGYFYKSSDPILQGMEEITVSIWAKKNSLSAQGYLISKHLHYQIGIFSSYIRAYIMSESGVQSTIVLYYGSDIPNDLEWHLYSMTYNGTDIYFYVDGVEINSNTLTGNINSDSSRNLFIGLKYENHSTYFNGNIDEVYIYDRALNSNEIQLLLTMPSGVDLIPPVILTNNPIIKTSSFVNINFTTNEPVNGQVEYCIDGTCIIQYYATLMASHNITLSSLIPFGTYTYILTMYDEAGNETISDQKEFTLNDVFIVNKFMVDTLWQTIDQQCIDTIRDKNILFGSRSWGPYVVNGIQDIDPLYTYERIELDHFEEFSSNVFDNYNMAHFMNESWPFDLRWIHLDEYIRGRAGLYNIDAALQLVYGTPTNIPPADIETMFNDYTAQIDQLIIDFPNVDFVVFTHHLTTQEDPISWNGYAGQYSQWIIDKYSGVLPIIDIHDIMSIYNGVACEWNDDGTIKRKMCSEYNSGDYVHPNTQIAEELLAKSYYLAMSKLYCE